MDADRIRESGALEYGFVYPDLLCTSVVVHDLVQMHGNTTTIEIFCYDFDPTPISIVSAWCD